MSETENQSIAQQPKENAQSETVAEGFEAKLSNDVEKEAGEEVADEDSGVKDGQKKRTLEDAGENGEGKDGEGEGVSKKEGEGAAGSADHGSRKKKKHRRRQYDDDVPKETKSENEDGKDDDNDNDNDEALGVEAEDEDDDDDLLEIDESNIITTGRRTRGKVIDFAKAAEKLKEEEGNQEDEDEDGEFDEEQK